MRLVEVVKGSLFKHNLKSSIRFCCKPSQQLVSIILNSNHSFSLPLIETRLRVTSSNSIDGLERYPDDAFRGCRG